MTTNTSTQATPTRLLLVILKGADRDTLLHRLLDAEFRVTEFASVGGFLRRKSTTLVIGVAKGRVEEALAIIRETCPTPPDADEHRATIFVLNTRQFIAV
jgi:uncharacterized protein YaaQ